ncbi:MAG: polyphenol oxidase family protein [Acidobacteria bacterium]|nr:polyphenol oxidase family protein [Acidobacteriota bacterium]
MAAASYSSPSANDALAVYHRGPVWAAFLGAVPPAEAAGPEDALEILARQVPAADAAAPAWLRQRHGADALRATGPGPTGDGDALIVSASGVAATVFVADCVPVLIAAGDSVAAVHAGWRGLAGGVLASAVRELNGGDSFRDGARAEAWIGPAIGPCCYEVGEDVAVQVASRSGAEVVARRPGRKPHLDLALAASRQLARLGVARVSTVKRCVRCSPDWWSYRRDGARAGRNYGFIWREECY